MPIYDLRGQVDRVSEEVMGFEGWTPETLAIRTKKIIIIRILKISAMTLNPESRFCLFSPMDF